MLLIPEAEIDSDKELGASVSNLASNTDTEPDLKRGRR